VRYVARMGDRRGACRVLVGRPDKMRPLGRPRRRWQDNFKMDLQEAGCGDLDCELLWARIGTGGRRL
jgi:hypothetical protein